MSQPFSLVGKGKRISFALIDVYGVRGTPGAYADPTALTFTWNIVDPITQILLMAPVTWVWQTNAQLVKDGTGLFHVRVVPPVAGLLNWEYFTPPTSDLPESASNSFLVSPPTV